MNVVAPDIVLPSGINLETVPLDGRVEIGHIVTLTYSEDGKVIHEPVRIYHKVVDKSLLQKASSNKPDPISGIIDIADDSPVAQQLLGKQKGNEINILVGPKGKETEIKYTVETIQKIISS